MTVRVQPSTRPLVNQPRPAASRHPTGAVAHDSGKPDPCRAAYDPAILVAVLLYAYCLGWRSSRVIERRRHEDVAFRVLAGGLAPDHVMIARFRTRHGDALAAVLVDSLRLCAAAGLLRLGTVALDGTKLAAPAARSASRTVEGLQAEVDQILAHPRVRDLSHRDAPDRYRGQADYEICQSSSRKS